MRGDGVADEAGAGGAGAAADRHVDLVDARVRLQQFEIRRRVAVDDRRVVGGPRARCGVQGAGVESGGVTHDADDAEAGKVMERGRARRIKAADPALWDAERRFVAQLAGEA